MPIREAAQIRVRIETHVDGELRQEDALANMMLSIRKDGCLRLYLHHALARRHHRDRYALGQRSARFDPPIVRLARRMHRYGPRMDADFGPFGEVPVAYA